MGNYSKNAIIFANNLDMNYNSSYYVICFVDSHQHTMLKFMDKSLDNRDISHHVFL